MSDTVLAFDILTFGDNVFNLTTEAGQRFILILGITLLILAAYMGWKYIAHQRKVQGPPPVSPFWALAALIAGGIFLFGGLPTLTDLARGGQDTLVKLGQSTSTSVQVNPNTKGSVGMVDLAAKAEACIGWFRAMVG
ncbi:hypothetical protein [Caniella muris]|uniref:hypothetical protein n=1 Tax=Caniella muris TaxID=2941502 RepID=UPI00203E40DF|nr:hypothetical protein [Caniella muris]